MSSEKEPSQNSLIAATKSRAKFSGHGGAKGAAGKRQKSYDPENSELLHNPGDSVSVSPGKEGFETITIAADWNEIAGEKSGFFGKLVGITGAKPVDIDLGCLYELEDGSRGAIQAFGEKFGDFDKPPFIKLSGDERTGKTAGHDEFITVNGSQWKNVKRMLVYLYIYQGATKWLEVAPRVFVDIPGENDLVVTLKDSDDSLALCAVAGLEQIRGGVKLTNYTEYFPGHAAMDRAFGFGLEWDEGEKSR